MNDHTTGTSPERLALSGSAAHRRADPAQSKYLTWYMSQHLADVNRALHLCTLLINRLECYHSFDKVLDEYLTANPTALRQEDPR